MRVSLLLLALLLAACDDKPKQSNDNTGSASVNINAGGDVSTCNPIVSGTVNATVKIECGPGIPPAALEKLEAYLTEQQRSGKNLNDLIDQQRKAIIDWEKKYRDQEANLREALALMPNDQLLKAAQLALQQGDLEKAAQLREQRFQEWEEKSTTKLAAEAVRKLEEKGAFFSRPYKEWAEAAYRQADDESMTKPKCRRGPGVLFCESSLGY